MVVDKRWALKMVLLVAVVVVVVVVIEIFCMVVVVVVMVMVSIHIPILDLGQLSKAMFNRAQNLYLSGVLLPY